MNEIIEETLKKGIPVKMEYNQEKKRVEYSIDGFYKSGNIKLIENNYGVLISHSRYDTANEIKSFNDIVRLNYEWWELSKNRFIDWSEPDSMWLPHLLELGLVDEKIIKKYE